MDGHENLLMKIKFSSYGSWCQVLLW